MGRRDPVQILVTLNLNYLHILAVMLYSLVYSNPEEQCIIWIMHPSGGEWELEKMITDEWIRENTVFVHYCTRNKPWKKNYVGKLGIYWRQFEQMMAADS